MVNGAVRKEAVHRILLVCENLEYRVQLCADRQAQMNRPDIKQFQRTAGLHNQCVTEDQGAESVIVNLRHAREVEDDIRSPCYHERDYRSTKDRLRITADGLE